MIEIGDRAPEFSLPGHSSERTDSRRPDQFTLAEALVDGPLVLNFYLFDFHPECTKHVCDLHDLSWFDINDDVSVYGVSTDRTFSHGAFADSQALEMPLLSDSDGSVAAAYGVLYDEFQGHKQIAKRSVFVVDVDGTVQYAWSTDDPASHPDWTAVNDVVTSLTSG